MKTRATGTRVSRCSAIGTGRGLPGTSWTSGLLHTHRPPPHAKIFDVRLHPKGREPVMAEVHLSPHDPRARF